MPMYKHQPGKPTSPSAKCKKASLSPAPDEAGADGLRRLAFWASPCLLCKLNPRRPRQVLCGACYQQMPWHGDTFFVQQHAFLAACHYRWPVDRLIHLFKYQERLELLPILVELLLHCPRPEVQALVPVPLSRQKLAKRGFNQALLLANALSRHWHIPVWQPFLRHDGVAQRDLSRQERLSNLKGAFYVNPVATRVIARHVLVIDDVLTTGSTFLALQGALQELGVNTVQGLCLAKAE